MYPDWSLEEYIDLALQLNGSIFTVGMVEEDHNMAATPQPSTLMVTALESRPFMSAVPESLHEMAASPEITHSSSLGTAASVLEMDNVLSVLPVMATAILFVLATHTAVVSPEMAAFAAEPDKVLAPTLLHESDPTSSPEKATDPKSSPEKATDPKSSPERTSVPEFGPERASVPEFGPERTSVPEFGPERASVPHIYLYPRLLFPSLAQR